MEDSGVLKKKKIKNEWNHSKCWVKLNSIWCGFIVFLVCGHAYVCQQEKKIKEGRRKKKY